MEELQAICRSKLIDADLHIELESEFNNINLVFIPGDDSTEEVTIECRGIHSFKIIRHPEDDPPYIIGGVQVLEASKPSDIQRILSAEGWNWDGTQLPERAYEIRVEGGIDLFIACTQIWWETTRLNEARRHYRPRLRPYGKEKLRD